MARVTNWSTREKARAFVLTLAAALGTMAPLCQKLDFYEGDIEKICTSESASGISARTGDPLFDWLKKRVATPEAVVLVNELATKAPRDKAAQLRNEARKVNVAACPLADSFEAQAKDDDIKQDFANLCGERAMLDTGSVALLDITSAPDDAERMREIREWTRANAKTPNLAAVVDRMAQTAPKDRGKMLRGEAAKLAVTSCQLADALDRPPPPPMKAAPPPVLPNFSVVKFDGSRKYSAQVSAGLRDNQDSIVGCYASGLAGNPTLTGKVAIKMAVDLVGRVTSAKDDGSSLSDKKVIKCIADALGASKFPETGQKTGEKFTVTLLLTPTTSTAAQPSTDVPVPKH